MILLLSILNLSGAAGDKVLVFTQSLLTLNLIQNFLIFMEERSSFSSSGFLGVHQQQQWRPQADFYRLDGSVPAEKRKKWIDEFNDVKKTSL